MIISPRLLTDCLNRKAVFILLFSFFAISCGDKESLGKSCTPSFKSQHPSEIHIENGPGFNCDTWYCLSVANESGKRYNYCTETCNSDADCSDTKGMICRNLHYNGDYSDKSFCIRSVDFQSGES